MKHIRFILLTLTFTLLLTACERPAPEGDIPAPAEIDNPELVPRTEESDPAAQPEETAPENAEPADAAAPADEAAPDAETGEATEETEVQPAEGEGTASTDDAEPETPEGESADNPPPLENGVYVVRDGDSLGQIAFIYGVSVEDIMVANDLTNPDILDVGQELVIPDAGFAETQEPPSDDTTVVTDDPASDDAEEQIHIVQAGDNLYRIGLRYGFTVDELAEYNGMTDVNNLEVGQEIKIPPSS